MGKAVYWPVESVLPSVHPTVLQQAVVTYATIVCFTKSQFEDEIGDFGPLTLSFSGWQTVKRAVKGST